MTDNSRSVHPRWIQFFLAFDLLGVFLFLLGLQPGLFGLDRSRVIGYVQAIVFLLGLGLVTLCSFASERLLRPAGKALTIREDIGARLAATGYVLASVASTADLIGLGSHPVPGTPHFGLLQSAGLLIGVLILIAGLFLYYPGHRKKEG
jgi:hypothetical protein